MTHTVANVARAVAITGGNLNMTSTKGIDYNGDWFVYYPKTGFEGNNAGYGANIDIYKWDTNLPLVSGNVYLTMEGTIAQITEPWEGANVKYHGSCIEYIGPGENDITNALEDDAFFFSHLGSLSPTTDDDAFYWDRAFLADGGSNWDYYQYHKHLPTSYVKYENGRMTHGAGLYLNPSDKAFGYTIHSVVKVSGTDYQSVLARVHTPSIGGAHNSHNDVTLPSTSNKNYMQGGILKGSGDRYHAFYITSNGTEWDVFSRTYVQTTGSFSSEVNIGKYNLADPAFTVSSVATGGNCAYYPVRASAGDVLGTRVHFPVLMTNTTTSSNFDLEVWSFTSADTIAAGTLTRTTLYSNVTVRPDCHIVTVGENMYALTSNIGGGGTDLFVYEDNVWETPGVKVTTNGNTKHVRVHGLKYNTQDVKFYALLSGTQSNVGANSGSYLGPGLYTFQLAGDFAGYKHLDYDTSNNALLVRNPLTANHLIYENSSGTITSSPNAEPQGIASGQRILEYIGLTPEYYNRSDLSLGGDEYIYHGIYLKDNRKLLAGRIGSLTYGDGTFDLLVSIVNQDNTTGEHFAYGGIEPDSVVDINGDDYITSVFQSNVSTNKVWFTGYTKSELVEKKDMKIHGYCRSITDAPNLLRWNDLVKDSNGDIYVVGSSSDEVCLIAKYNYNYVLQWQKQLSSDNNIYGNSIASDGTYLYIVGTIVTDDDLFVCKLNNDGTLVWITAYGTASAETGTGIAVVTKSGTKYIVLSLVGGTTTTFLVLNEDGTVYEQNEVANLAVNKVRNDTVSTTGGFLFAGTDGSTNGKFGMCEVGHGSRMVRWTSTYGTEMRDISAIDSGPTYGYIVAGKSNTSGNAAILKCTVTESGGSYTVSKSWARKLATSEFNGLYTSPSTDTNRFAYVVGMATTGGSPAMGMDEGIVAKYNNSGTIQWQNVFGHDMDESLTAVISDITGDNIVLTGWSESHSNARDAILFRCENGGFGTGVYHLNGSAGVPYYYLASSLSDTSDTGSLTNLTAPSNVTGTATENTSIPYFDLIDSGGVDRIFDGSYGKNGTFMLHFGYIDLKKVQEYLNSNEYKENQIAGRKVNYTRSIFTFYQVSTVGDGTADDGNVFGYDIIETAAGEVYIIGQTSGDILKTNQGTSGVYDYILIKFDPATEEIEYYQNGTELDEETYALCELSNGKIAFTGRTTGTLGNTNLGGYDIFVGVYDPTNDSFVYRSTGTGLDDRGMNLHDLGANTLAITYTSYGNLSVTPSIGTEDVGVLYYFYGNHTFGNAYQTGTITADLVEQNGKPSALLTDGRIAITFSTAGSFEKEGIVPMGFLDMALVLFDRSTNTFTRSMVGSQSTDIASSIDARGERLLISGHAADTFGSDGQGIYVESDVQFGVGGKSAVR